MNTDKFDALLSDTFDKLQRINITKGREYSGSEDRLANFKRQANPIGISPESILLVYMNKHIDSIHTFVKDLQTSTGFHTIAELEAKLSEPIEGRIDDVIMYCCLLKGLIADRRESEAG
jgi:hypothetical protein